jgi:hypothetical protein
VAAPDTSRRPRLAGALLPLLATAVLAGCGRDGSDLETGIPSGYPTVASSDVDGRFDMTEIVAEGHGVDLDGRATPVVSVDVVTGGIEVDVVCNRYLGSFTLDPDQRASVTLTGGTSEDCGADNRLEAAIVEIFDRVDHWDRSAGGFQLTSTVGDLIGLTRS